GGACHRGARRHRRARRPHARARARHRRRGRARRRAHRGALRGPARRRHGRAGRRRDSVRAALAGDPGPRASRRDRGRGWVAPAARDHARDGGAAVSAAERGAGLVELLVAAVLAVVVLGMLTAAVAGGARLLTTAGRRGEAEDTAQLALEALLFDVRRAGYDPRGVGVEALAATSEETITWVCNLAARRLSRLVGRQSLPLADDARTCALGYLDAAGAPLATPPGGLAAADRARVRSVTLTLALAPPGLARPATRSLRVALRTPP